MPSVLVINSLDPWHGSTYRIRALYQSLLKLGWPVEHLEVSGGILRKTFFIAKKSLFASYDILFIQKFNPITLCSIFIALTRRKKVVVDWDDLDSGLQRSSIKKWIASFCEAIGPRFVHRITTHSKTVSQRTPKSIPSDIIPQGFEPTFQRPISTTKRDQLRKQFQCAPQDTLIVYMCTFTSGGAMDIDLVFQAWSTIKKPSTRFLLLGDGPLKQEIIHKLKSFHLFDRTTLTGLVDQSLVAQYLQSADIATIYMSDTLANRVRSSFKLLEYIAASIPAVGQTVGETHQRLGNFVHDSTPENFGQTLHSFSDSPPLLATPEDISSYSWENSATKLAQSLQKAYDY